MILKLNFVKVFVPVLIHIDGDSYHYIHSTCQKFTKNLRMKHHDEIKTFRNSLKCTEKEETYKSQKRKKRENFEEHAVKQKQTHLYFI